MGLTCNDESLKHFNPNTQILCIKEGKELTAEDKGWWIGRVWRHFTKGTIYKLSDIATTLQSHPAIKNNVYTILKDKVPLLSQKATRVFQSKLLSPIQPWRETLNTHIQIPIHFTIKDVSYVAYRKDNAICVQNEDNYGKDSLILISISCSSPMTISVNGSAVEKTPPAQLALLQSVASTVESCEPPRQLDQQPEVNEYLGSLGLKSSSVYQTKAGVVVVLDPPTTQPKGPLQQAYLDDAKNIRLENAYLIPQEATITEHNARNKFMKDSRAFLASVSTPMISRINEDREVMCKHGFALWKNPDFNCICIQGAKDFIGNSSTKRISIGLGEPMTVYVDDNPVDDFAAIRPETFQLVGLATEWMTRYETAKKISTAYEKIYGPHIQSVNFSVDGTGSFTGYSVTHDTLSSTTIPKDNVESVLQHLQLPAGHAPQPDPIEAIRNRLPSEPQRPEIERTQVMTENGLKAGYKITYVTPPKTPLYIDGMTDHFTDTDPSVFFHLVLAEDLPRFLAQTQPASQGKAPAPQPAVAKAVTPTAIDPQKVLHESLQIINKALSLCPVGIRILPQQWSLYKEGSPAFEYITLNSTSQVTSFSLNEPLTIFVKGTKKGLADIPQDQIALIQSIAKTLQSSALPPIQVQQDQKANEIQGALKAKLGVNSTNLTRNGSGYVMRYDTLQPGFKPPAEWHPIFLDTARTLQLVNAYFIPNTYVDQLLSPPKPPVQATSAVVAPPPHVQGAPQPAATQPTPVATQPKPPTPQTAAPAAPVVPPSMATPLSPQVIQAIQEAASLLNTVLLTHPTISFDTPSGPLLVWKTADGFIHIQPIEPALKGETTNQIVINSQTQALTSINGVTPDKVSSQEFAQMMPILQGTMQTLGAFTALMQPQLPAQHQFISTLLRTHEAKINAVFPKVTKDGSLAGYVVTYSQVLAQFPQSLAELGLSQFYPQSKSLPVPNVSFLGINKVANLLKADEIKQSLQKQLTGSCTVTDVIPQYAQDKKTLVGYEVRYDKEASAFTKKTAPFAGLQMASNPRAHFIDIKNVDGLLVALAAAPQPVVVQAAPPVTHGAAVLKPEQAQITPLLNEFRDVAKTHLSGPLSIRFTYNTQQYVMRKYTYQGVEYALLESEGDAGKGNAQSIAISLSDPIVVTVNKHSTQPEDVQENQRKLLQDLANALKPLSPALPANQFTQETGSIRSRLQQKFSGLLVTSLTPPADPATSPKGYLMTYSKIPQGFTVPQGWIPVHIDDQKIFKIGYFIPEEFINQLPQLPAAPQQAPAPALPAGTLVPVLTPLQTQTLLAQREDLRQSLKPGELKERGDFALWKSDDGSYIGIQKRANCFGGDDLKGQNKITIGLGDPMTVRVDNQEPQQVDPTTLQARLSAVAPAIAALQPPVSAAAAAAVPIGQQTPLSGCFRNIDSSKAHPMKVDAATYEKHKTEWKQQWEKDHPTPAGVKKLDPPSTDLTDDSTRKASIEMAQTKSVGGKVVVAAPAWVTETQAQSLFTAMRPSALGEKFEARHIQRTAQALKLQQTLEGQKAWMEDYIGWVAENPNSSPEQQAKVAEYTKVLPEIPKKIATVTELLSLYTAKQEDSPRAATLRAELHLPLEIETHQVTNMEAGGLRTLTTAIAEVEMTGDYTYANKQHSIVPLEQIGGAQQARTVLVSTTVQPDFETGSTVLATCRVEKDSIQPLEGFPPPITPVDKQDDGKRQEYDNKVKQALVGKLVGKGGLPALKNVPPQEIYTPTQVIGKLEELLKNGASPQAIDEAMKHIFVGLTYFEMDPASPTFKEVKTETISGLMFFKMYVESLGAELSALEATCPQGYVYTSDPPSIFASCFSEQTAKGIIPNPTAINRFQMLALKYLCLKQGGTTPFPHMKAFAFNNYADNGALAALRLALPADQNGFSRVYAKKDFFPEGKPYTPLPGMENYALVLHNNSDGYGFNLLTECGIQSMDAIYGRYSNAAAVLMQAGLPPKPEIPVGKDKLLFAHPQGEQPAPGPAAPLKEGQQPHQATALPPQIQTLLTRQTTEHQPIFPEKQKPYVESLFAHAFSAQDNRVERFYSEFLKTRHFYTPLQQQELLQTAMALNLLPLNESTLQEASKSILPILQALQASEKSALSTEELQQSIFESLPAEVKKTLTMWRATTPKEAIVKLHSFFKVSRDPQIATMLEANQLVHSDDEFAAFLRSKLQDVDTVQTAAEKIKHILDIGTFSDNIASAWTGTDDSEKLLKLSKTLRSTDRALSWYLQDLAHPTEVFDRLVDSARKYIENPEELKTKFHAAKKDPAKIQEFLKAIKPKNQENLLPIAYPLLNPTLMNPFESWANQSPLFLFGQSKHIVGMFVLALLSPTPQTKLNELLAQNKYLTNTQKLAIREIANQLNPKAFPEKPQPAPQVQQPQAQVPQPAFVAVGKAMPGTHPVEHNPDTWLQKFATAGASYEEKKRVRVEIYDQTQVACRDGYKVGDKVFIPDPQSAQRLQAQTKKLSTVTTPLADPTVRYDTQIEVMNMDCLDATEKMQKVEGLNPATLNMANRYHPGGGVKRGAGAQEECVWRCTNAYLSLDPDYNPDMEYPLPETDEVVVSQGVSVFRRPHAGGYAFREDPFMINLVSVAAYCCSKKGKTDKCDRPIDQAAFEAGMVAKLTRILDGAALLGCDGIILGAFGCGAFEDEQLSNRTALFKLLPQILDTPKFKGRFKKIYFAVLDTEPGAPLFNAFYQKFDSKAQKGQQAAPVAAPSAPQAQVVVAAAAPKPPEELKEPTIKDQIVPYSIPRTIIKRLTWKDPRQSIETKQKVQAISVDSDLKQYQGTPLVVVEKDAQKTTGLTIKIPVANKTLQAVLEPLLGKPTPSTNTKYYSGEYHLTPEQMNKFLSDLGTPLETIIPQKQPVFTAPKPKAQEGKALAPPIAPVVAAAAAPVSASKPSMTYVENNICEELKKSGESVDYVKLKPKGGFKVVLTPQAPVPTHKDLKPFAPHGTQTAKNEYFLSNQAADELLNPPEKDPIALHIKGILEARLGPEIPIKNVIRKGRAGYEVNYAQPVASFKVPASSLPWLGTAYTDIAMKTPNEKAHFIQRKHVAQLLYMLETPPSSATSQKPPAAAAAAAVAPAAAPKAGGPGAPPITDQIVPFDLIRTVIKRLTWLDPSVSKEAKEAIQRMTWETEPSTLPGTPTIQIQKLPHQPITGLKIRIPPQNTTIQAVLKQFSIEPTSPGEYLLDAPKMEKFLTDLGTPFNDIMRARPTDTALADLQTDPSTVDKSGVSSKPPVFSFPDTVSENLVQDEENRVKGLFDRLIPDGSQKKETVEKLAAFWKRAGQEGMAGSTVRRHCRYLLQLFEARKPPLTPQEALLFTDIADAMEKACFAAQYEQFDSSCQRWHIGRASGTVESPVSSSIRGYIQEFKEALVGAIAAKSAEKAVHINSYLKQRWADLFGLHALSDPYGYQGMHALVPDLGMDEKAAATSFLQTYCGEDQHRSFEIPQDMPHKDKFPVAPGVSKATILFDVYDKIREESASKNLMDRGQYLMHYANALGDTIRPKIEAHLKEHLKGQPEEKITQAINDKIFEIKKYCVGMDEDFGSHGLRPEAVELILMSMGLLNITDMAKKIIALMASAEQYENTVNPPEPATQAPQEAPAAAEAAPTTVTVQVQPAPLTAQMTPETVKELRDMQMRFSSISPQAKPIAQLVTRVTDSTITPDDFKRQFGTLMPPPLLTDLSKPPTPELSKKLDEIKALEQRIKEKYGHDLANYLWHGGSSFQRIIFQDPEFTAQFADPVFIMALFYRLYTDSYESAQTYEYPAFSGKFTFPAMVIKALTENSLDFLLGASPNWANKQPIEGFEWNLGSLGLAESIYDEASKKSPNKLHDLRGIKQGLEAFQRILPGINLQGPKATEREKQVEVEREINKASAKQLRVVIRNILLARKSKPITVGGAKESTQAYEMVSQVVDGLANYHGLKEKLDTATVLEIGLISHMLDGQHLLAGIAHIEGLLDAPQKPTLLEMKAVLNELLKACEDGSEGPEVTFLLMSRLRQVVHILLTRCQEDEPLVYTLDQALKDLRAAV